MTSVALLRRALDSLRAALARLPLTRTGSRTRRSASRRRTTRATRRWTAWRLLPTGASGRTAGTAWTALRWTSGPTRTARWRATWTALRRTLWPLTRLPRPALLRRRLRWRRGVLPGRLAQATGALRPFGPDRSRLGTRLRRPSTIVLVNDLDRSVVEVLHRRGGRHVTRRRAVASRRWRVPGRRRPGWRHARRRRNLRGRAARCRTLHRGRRRVALRTRARRWRLTRLRRIAVLRLAVARRVLRRSSLTMRLLAGLTRRRALLTRLMLMPTRWLLAWRAGWRTVAVRRWRVAGWRVAIAVVALTVGWRRIRRIAGRRRRIASVLRLRLATALAFLRSLTWLPLSGRLTRTVAMLAGRRAVAGRIAVVRRIAGWRVVVLRLPVRTLPGSAGRLLLTGGGLAGGRLAVRLTWIRVRRVSRRRVSWRRLATRRVLRGSAVLRLARLRLTRLRGWRLLARLDLRWRTGLARRGRPWVRACGSAGSGRVATLRASRRPTGSARVRTRFFGTDRQRVLPGTRSRHTRGRRSGWHWRRLRLRGSLRRGCDDRLGHRDRCACTGRRHRGCGCRLDIDLDPAIVFWVASSREVVVCGLERAADGRLHFG